MPIYYCSDDEPRGWLQSELDDLARNHRPGCILVLCYLAVVAGSLWWALSMAGGR